MFTVKTVSIFAFFILGLTACGGGWDDDLNPSGVDKRPVVEAGSSGTQTSQKTPDFTVQDTLNNSVTLYDELASSSAVVLYFTMWCPVCNVHSSHMRYTIPKFPQVSFFLVDYVTGSVEASYAAQVANGYSDITTLVDASLTLSKLYNGTMGTTVVIDSTGIIRMNEDYKDGLKLQQTLEALP